MIIVDSHCHALLAWFEPVESLVDQMDRHGVAPRHLWRDRPASLSAAGLALPR